MWWGQNKRRCPHRSWSSGVTKPDHRKRATIGAGAVVISDISANKTVVGVPAK